MKNKNYEKMTREEKIEYLNEISQNTKTQELRDSLLEKCEELLNSKDEKQKVVEYKNSRSSSVFKRMAWVNISIALLFTILSAHDNINEKQDLETLKFLLKNSIYNENEVNENEVVSHARRINADGTYTYVDLIAPSGYVKCGNKAIKYNSDGTCTYVDLIAPSGFQIVTEEIEVEKTRITR